MWLPVTTRGVEIPRWLATGVASSALLAMVFTTNELILDPPAAVAAVEPDPASLYDSNGDGIPDRPDRVSAALLARQIDLPVEDMSARTESATTVVEPDGALTLEDFGGPVRIQRDAADPETGELKPSWVDVDYTLTEIDGGRYAPAASPATVVVGGAWNGQPEAARVEFDDGSALAITWPGGDLGEPTVEGGVATYEISESMDLVVAMTTAGASAWVRINDELTAAETTAIEAGGVTFGLRTTGGANLITTEDALATDATLAPDVHTDGLVLTNPEGEAVGATSNLVAWDDSTTDATGMPDETVPLEVELEATGTSGTGAEKVTAHELTVTPPEGFLTGADVEYPVVIDPQVEALTQVQDTWVRGDIAGGNGSDMKLLVGRTPTSGTFNANSYLHFNTAPLNGKDIARAELGLYQYYSGSSDCSPKAMNVHAVSGTWTEGNMSWSTQPGVQPSGFSVVSDNRGGSACSTERGIGYTAVNITPMAKNWANGTWANRGVRLATPSGADFTSERRFCSMNTSTAFNVCNVASQKPYLKVTYNTAPTYSAVPRLGAGVGMTWNNVLNVSTGRPLFISASIDDDGTRVRNYIEARPNPSSGTVSSFCRTEFASSGQHATCQLGTALSNGQSYSVRARGEDENGAIGPWSGWRDIRINNTTPIVAAQNCGPYTDGAWYETRPAATATCAFTAAGTVVTQWTVNGETVPSTTPSGGGTSSITVDVPASGWTSIVGQGFTSAGVATPLVVYGFGTGQAGLNEPVTDTPSSTTVPVQATGPQQNATSASIQWRRAPAEAGNTTTGWEDATDVVVASSGAPWEGALTTPANTSVVQTPRLLWHAADEVEGSGVVELRVKFNYSNSGARATPSRLVHLLSSGFADSAATHDLGPATVALSTGEVMLDGTDPGQGAAGLSVNRRYLSYAGEVVGAASVFGPAWSADLAGAGTGVAGYSVRDRTAQDGTLEFVGADGVAWTFRHESGTRGAQQNGSYIGVGDVAGTLDTLSLAEDIDAVGDPAEVPEVSHRMTLTAADGSVTDFARVQGGAGWEWVTTSSAAAGASATTYQYNADGTVAWIVAPSPAGVTCSVGSLAAGCRALQLVYAGEGVGVDGGKRLTQVKLYAYNPQTVASTGLPGATAGMSQVVVAQFEYDAEGRLAAAWDPRLGTGSSALKTSYSYGEVNSQTVVQSVQEPGRAPWSFTYDETGRLATVERPQAAGVGVGNAVWRVVYGLSTSQSGLPNLDAAEVARWGQPSSSAPVAGSAVFGPERPIAGAPAEADWPYASLHYFDESGRVTNAAVYGAGEWLITSNTYDTHGNVVRELTAEGRKEALAIGSGNASVTATAADTLSTRYRYSADGARVEEIYEPARDVMLADGSMMFGSPLTEITYDDEAAAALVPGRPSDVPDGFGLQVESISSVVATVPAGADVSRRDGQRTRYQYDSVQAGDVSGWALRTPTRVMVEDPAVSSGWATTVHRYDSQGREIEKRSPGAVQDGAVSDPRVTQTVYYTADGSASISACRNNARWAGQVCVIRPTGAPATGPALPSESYLGYSMGLSPTRVTETSGSTSRLTVTQLDGAERATQTTTTVGSISRSLATTYDTTTGDAATVSGNGTTVTTTTDSWGRPISESDGAGNTTTSTYDVAGRLATFNDGRGTYTYQFGGTDAEGRIERRDLVTSVDTGYSSGSDDVIRVAYDSSARPVTQVYPGGYEANYGYDTGGNLESLDYRRESGDQTQGIASYAQSHDHFGRVRSLSGPVAQRTSAYDLRGRLVSSTERSAGVCSARSYTYSADSNRTSLSNFISDESGQCQSTPASSETLTHDKADRITTTGYVYDALGRTTTVPRDHTDQAGVVAASNLTIGYHVNDMLASLQQTTPTGIGSTTTVERQDFGLDPLGRVSTINTLRDGVVLKESRHHFAGSVDGAAWTSTRTRPDASSAWVDSWTRNISDPAGLLALSQSSENEATLHLTNPHGDIAMDVDVATGTVESYSEYSEFGATTGAPSGGSYGWLGSYQRENQGLIGGVSLMGARVYNPSTGRFLQLDQVRGGTDNPYVYPQDPVNAFDLAGYKTVTVYRKTWSNGDRARTAARRFRRASQLAEVVKDGMGKVPTPGWGFAVKLVISLVIDLLAPYGPRIAGAIDDKTKPGSRGSRTGVTLWIGIANFGFKAWKWRPTWSVTRN